jgi:hypothetical protein
MHRSVRSAAACLLQVVALASFAYAQDAVDDPEQQGRFRLGPLRYTPSIQVTSLGVDTNVFNELDDPKQDTTFALGPTVDLWLKLGRARLTGKTGIDYNYFQRYESQRFFGTRNEARLSVPLNRLTPFVEGRYTNTRQRPGYEIDVRARRTQTLGRAGVDVRVGARTTVTVGASRQQYRFAAEEEFLGSDLSYALDNDANAVDLKLARRLTPLTTFVVSAEQRQDRFRFSHVRDADASKVVAGFEFKPFALIDGQIDVGYRRFHTLDPLVPEYDGLIASGDLGYSVRATRLTLRIERDIQYSFQQFEPFYLLNDVEVGVTQRITTKWDVVSRIARQTLDYSVVSLPGDLARKDHGWRYGAGLGYRLGEYIRLGFDVDRFERQSDITARRYDSWRAGGSLTYGIKQR